MAQFLPSIRKACRIFNVCVFSASERLFHTDIPLPEL
uniref:Uncharacterized protein n=1 Tax=Anguilla anguilla TaxID=7936 RepID=A0A0E9SXH8_ANGAN